MWLEKEGTKGRRDIGWGGTIGKIGVDSREVANNVFFIVTYFTQRKLIITDKNTTDKKTTEMC